ncbi:uncharacterized protein with FMN-binding domain [Ruminiclostridium sufflavum DSM 19573]|uniref:Uncharacterized protein with FMN-binding domain n=1 Tax=Ruminiclostridium sufflavum DSM 19573 TaxID=1121337 RepID=A0A318Y8T7_9FIRM|nr:FMN-binding protein [Ruminiclostridium sufflavum]PYG88728.1 uncharacterized protein with FMN-binding domain [Ruminiclostridium sufflavum DSM 19573]
MKNKRFFACAAIMLVLLSAGCSTEQTDNSSVKKEAAGQSAEAGKIKDGIYSGVARGYKKGLHVNVTVKDSKIADVEIGKNNEDEPYLTDSMVVIEQIVETQSTEVDAVAGATKTCKGIAKAVDNALEKAK